MTKNGKEMTKQSLFCFLFFNMAWTVRKSTVQSQIVGNVEWPAARGKYAVIVFSSCRLNYYAVSVCGPSRSNVGHWTRSYTIPPVVYWVLSVAVVAGGRQFYYYSTQYRMKGFIAAPSVMGCIIGRHDIGNNNRARLLGNTTSRTVNRNRKNYGALSAIGADSSVFCSVLYIQVTRQSRFEWMDSGK